MTYIHTPKAPQAIGPYSQAVRIDSTESSATDMISGLIFTSGAIALKSDGSFINGDIRAQTTQVMENLQAILQAAGADLHCVVKTTCFLADMEDFAEFNAVYEQAFGTHKPARSTIAVKTLPKGALVEVEAIAYKNPKL